MREARHTLTGFLLSIKNDSALCVKNLVNLWTRICSISSACFIRMLTRTLLTLGSMKTFSFSFLATVNGFRSSSGELAASISGTLCLSAVWDAKFESESAAVSEDLTHCRYGLRDCDYKSSVAIELGSRKPDHDGQSSTLPSGWDMIYEKSSLIRPASTTYRE
jgi:hypothetical protein